jgi:hypothetical protein
MAAGHSYIGLTPKSRSPGDPHETQKIQFYPGAGTLQACQPRAIGAAGSGHRHLTT